MPETIDVTPASESSRDVSGSMTITHVMYAMHALAPFTAWLLAIVAMIIGMIKRDDVRGTWLESHYSWLSGTFWWGILWCVVTGVIFTVFSIVTLGLGLVLIWLFFLPVTVWYWYRIIRGWLKLNDLKPVL